MKTPPTLSSAPPADAITDAELARRLHVAFAGEAPSPRAARSAAAFALAQPRSSSLLDVFAAMFLRPAAMVALPGTLAALAFVVFAQGGARTTTSAGAADVVVLVFDGVVTTTSSSQTTPDLSGFFLGTSDVHDTGGG